MLFISPPFGNYISLPNMISINGSFTLEPRPGLISQIFKTLRYTNKGWINKIGLRNKGIDYAIENHDNKHITSIAIMKESDVPTLTNLINEYPKYLS